MGAAAGRGTLIGAPTCGETVSRRADPMTGTAGIIAARAAAMVGTGETTGTETVTVTVTGVFRKSVISSRGLSPVVISPVIVVSSLLVSVCKLLSAEKL